MIKSFKEKYIKNLFFYHVYRYFKYKFKFFQSFGATGEDVFINKIFKKKNGFYVDIGALHPINGSLTYNLYKKGWHGVNFDLLETNIRLFKFFRKRDTSHAIALSSKSGYIDSYIFNAGSGLNTLNKNWADKWSKLINKDYSIEKIEKKTLNEAINQFNIPKDFDFLNIDVEGHEIEVLRGINFKDIRPKIISIEIHVDKTEDIFTTKVFKFLKKQKYELISQYFHTSFFKRKNFKIKGL